LVAILGLIVASAGTASATGKHHSRTWVVKPGHSIQKVVDKARSGDTIKLKKGVYYDAVCVVGKGLTIIGAGQGRTEVPRSSRTATQLRLGCLERKIFVTSEEEFFS
jgi:pectin methylesterase-like acyl-CoA thioesterase